MINFDMELIQVICDDPELKSVKEKIQQKDKREYGKESRLVRGRDYEPIKCISYIT